MLILFLFVMFIFMSVFFFVSVFLFCAKYIVDIIDTV